MLIEKSVEAISDVPEISYEEALEQYMSSSEALNEVQEELSNIEHSLEIYSAISDTITKCGGVTKSLEVMFGENFSSAASMEGETMEKIKAGAKAAGDKIMELIKRFINWVKDLINVNKIRAKKLRKATVREDIKYPVTVTAGIPDDLKDVKVKEGSNFVKDFEESYKSLKKRTDLTKTTLNSKDEVEEYVDEVATMLEDFDEFIHCLRGFLLHSNDEKIKSIKHLVPQYISAARKYMLYIVNSAYKDACELVK